jgi:hypothetical protein
VLIESTGGNFSSGADILCKYFWFALLIFLALYKEAQAKNDMGVISDYWRKQYELNYVAATMATPFSPIINGITCEFCDCKFL